jgi:hypothetical protein
MHDESLYAERAIAGAGYIMKQEGGKKLRRPSDTS